MHDLTLLSALSAAEIGSVFNAGPNGYCAPTHRRAVSVLVTVDGRSGPWSWTNEGLNTHFQYGLRNHQDPTVVSLATRFDLTPGKRDK